MSVPERNVPTSHYLQHAATLDIYAVPDHPSPFSGLLHSRPTRKSFHEVMNIFMKFNNKNFMKNFYEIPKFHEKFYEIL
jgi:hypothetical protein